MTTMENNWLYEEEKPPVEDYIEAIIQFSNLNHHVYNCRPDLVPAWELMLETKVKGYQQSTLDWTGFESDNE